MVDPGTTLRGAALHDAKRELRARIVVARDALAPTPHHAASAAIAARIAALPSFLAARCVLLTVAFRSEWDTRALFAAAVGGKTVALPRVNAQDRMLELFAISDLDRDTAPGYRGIAEPRADLPRVTPDAVEWVLVPGVAFDLEGRRLGYGGGYYDRLLATLPESAARVAGALDLQVVPEVPSARHDLVIDTLATESRLLHFAR
ncbi:MAG: 5-formyltetrahydrofolate cyclo-ligase [Burkholderiales bacterium]|nr:5-formyltetrahydrofolate cyclo-ligase [Burkholderiales bacterium]